MIEFKPLTIETKEIYTHYFSDSNERGCELSFANLNMWGTHQYAILHDNLVFFLRYGKHYLYSYPIGSGDKKATIDDIIADAKERHISCRIVGLYTDADVSLEKLYPGKFSINKDRDSYDYVYDINDLASLQGRKYHKKRTHYNKFCKSFPDYSVVPLTENNINEIREMLDKWYHDRLTNNPDNDYHLEQEALKKALLHYNDLNMEGLILLAHDNIRKTHDNIDNNNNNNDTDNIFNKNHILAVTLGSQLSNDTFDVHFEKARCDVDGAYTVINNEFAKYIRDKYPHIKFLNREDDMGIEGLRKSKESYYPHHMIEKSMAILQEV